MNVAIKILEVSKEGSNNDGKGRNLLVRDTLHKKNGFNQETIRMIK
jgi:hypothetical protein